MEPLEIGNDDAAGVTEDVGDQLDVAAGFDDFVGGVGGRTVGGLSEETALELGGVFVGDDAFEGGGDEDGALELEELFVGDGLGAVEVAEDFLVVEVGEGAFEVDALGVVEGAGVVGDRDDFGAVGGEGEGGFAADVAEALDGDGGFAQRDFHIREVFFDEVGDAGAGGFAAALGAADGDGFAGDDGGGDVADVVGIGVHHPAHDFFVGADVGGGDIGVRPEEVDHFLHVAAGEVLEFGGGKLVGVDHDAALGAAVGEADERAFPAHPHGEGGDFADGDALVETDAALGGTGGEVVLDAVAFEDGDAAVVAFDGEGDGETAAGILGAVADGLREADGVGGLVELAARHAEDVGIVEGRDDGFGHGQERGVKMGPGAAAVRNRWRLGRRMVGAGRISNWLPAKGGFNAVPYSRGVAPC